MIKYETLVNEKKEIEKPMSSLRWIERVLKGDLVGDEKVALCIKQSQGTYHLGLSGDLMNQHSATILLVVESAISASEKRIAEIDIILGQADHLVDTLNGSLGE